MYYHLKQNNEYVYKNYNNTEDLKDALLLSIMPKGKHDYFQWEQLDAMCAADVFAFLRYELEETKNKL